jgi:hypothetical protein
MPLVSIKALSYSQFHRETWSTSVSIRGLHDAFHITFQAMIMILQVMENGVKKAVNWYH